jgi:hypothetical protein
VQVDVAPEIRRWLLWSLEAKRQFGYFQHRPMWAGIPPVGVAPLPSLTAEIDCSEFVTLICRLAGAPDPNGAGFAGWGNTQSLSAHNPQVGVANVIPFKTIVVYDVDRPLQYQHTAFVVAAGADPQTVSMGQPGDPSLVYVAQDGRTPFYYRIDTKAEVPAPAPQSAASKVPEALRPPLVTLPTLWRGLVEPHGAIVYWRLLLRAAGFWPTTWPVQPQGFGLRTENRTMAWQRATGQRVDGLVIPASWNNMGARDGA